MGKRNCRISVAEISFDEGPKQNIKINIDGKNVRIPVDASVFAYFREQFWREHPTGPQRRRFATMTNVTRAAYLKGYADGKKHHNN